MSINKTKNAKRKAITQNIALREKVLSFELWFFAFSFKFLAMLYNNNWQLKILFKLTRLITN